MEEVMMLKFVLLGAAALLGLGTPALAAASPTDPEIAHVAYTAGGIDIAAAKLALAKSDNPSVRVFAQEMVRDHQVVNDKALALTKKLMVTPQPNAISEALSRQADATVKRLAALSGATFDRAYVENEIDFHRSVNGALESTLIPSAHNVELKSLLQTGLTLFREHQTHAEQVADGLR